MVADVVPAAGDAIGVDRLAPVQPGHEVARLVRVVPLRQVRLDEVCVVARVEVRGDVARARFVEPDGRHGGLRIDGARVADPADKVLRGIGEPAGDVDPVGEVFQRRPDAGIRARYARNKVAGAAAIMPDQLPALPRIAGGERLVLGQRPLAGCQQDEDQAGERASHREPI